MDTTRDIVYRGFKLNDASIRENIDPVRGIGKGITGSVVDSWDPSDVDIVQFLEKRALQDGMDAGPVYRGARRLRTAGTLYGKTRGLLYDAYFDFLAAMDPVLAMREEPLDKGYRPLTFAVPTNRAAFEDTGAIDMMFLALPRAKQIVWQRDQQGGSDGDSLAIPWQATFLMKDPRVLALTPQDIDLSAGGTIAGDFDNRGLYLTYLDMVVEVTGTAGTIAITFGGSTLTITVPSSSGNRIIRYKGFDKVLTVEENSIEAIRYDLLSTGSIMTHPVIPPGASPYTFTFTGVSVQPGSHAFFYEAWG